MGDGCGHTLLPPPSMLSGIIPLAALLGEGAGLAMFCTLSSRQTLMDDALTHIAWRRGELWRCPDVGGGIQLQLYHAGATVWSRGGSHLHRKCAITLVLGIYTFTLNFQPSDARMPQHPSHLECISRGRRWNRLATRIWYPRYPDFPGAPVGTQG
jgi:hypothetical protein